MVSAGMEHKQNLKGAQREELLVASEAGRDSRRDCCNWALKKKWERENSRQVYIMVWEDCGQ
jgi:hypothetical protein